MGQKALDSLEESQLINIKGMAKLGFLHFAIPNKIKALTTIISACYNR